ncbi:MAG: helix-turn-helix domain-containing protein [Motilibacteraceae bacterium]
MEVAGRYYNTKELVRQLEALIAKLPHLSSPAPLRSNLPRVGTARQLDAEQIGELIADYRAGATVFALGEKFGIDRRTVGKILTRNGVKTKHPGLTGADVTQAAQLYDDGWSLARIGERLGVTATTVHRRLRERGVTMPPTTGASR